MVVHLAAFTDVDGCETDRARADMVNHLGTLNVVTAARRKGARVIYVSTDYVFDGEKGVEYIESDPPNPINVYGSTKLSGERTLDLSEDLIVRTSWVYGGSEDFFSKIRARWRTSNDRVRVVDDQWGKPTAADDLAEAIVFLLGDGRSGLIHISGEGPVTSWKQLAQQAIGDEGAVEGVSSAAYAAAATRPIAPRPRFSGLSLAKAREWQVPLHPWRESVARHLVGSR